MRLHQGRELQAIQEMLPYLQQLDIICIPSLPASIYRGCSNLVIEQVLMRSIKTVGGLTRGRGMTEIQRRIWLWSIPSYADVTHSMQELFVVSCNTSEQCRDSTQSQIKRDTKDTYVHRF